MVYREEKSVIIFFVTFSIVFILLLIVYGLTLKNNNTNNNNYNYNYNYNNNNDSNLPITISRIISTKKCEPTEVYIPWEKVKKYITINKSQKKFPVDISGSHLKTLRCLYFLTICDFGECLVENQKYLREEIWVKNSSEIVIGYYSLLVLEDVKCICKDDRALKKKIDKPWDVPVIQGIEENWLPPHTKNSDLFI